ncbi:MAG: phage tail tape measure protein, partial [Geminicoccaceae bacterium]|nr:phage tail tape measure protein [Geminicoccaceae bacterium]
MQKIVVIVGGGAAAAGPIVLGLGLLAGAISALLAPVGLVVAAIVGAGSLAAALYANRDAIEDALIGAIDALQAKFDAAIGWIGDVRQSFIDLKDGVLGSASDMVGGVTDYLGGRLSAAADLAVGAASRVSEAFRDTEDQVTGNSYVPDMVDEISRQFGRLQGEMVDPAGKATASISALFDKTGRDVGRSLAEMVDGADIVTSVSLEPGPDRDFLASLERQSAGKVDPRQESVDTALRRLSDGATPELRARVTELAGSLFDEAEAAKAAADAEKSASDIRKRGEAITLRFSDASVRLALDQSELDRLFTAGAISADIYGVALEEAQGRALASSTDIAAGASRALKSLATEAADGAAQMEQAIASGFAGAEDALVNFTQTGELAFSDLVDSILSDLARMAIRQAITAPLAGALGNFFAGGTGGGSALLSGATGADRGFAMGGVFTPAGVTAFASGGVVDRPTFFAFAQGVGLMGEKGEEAIMPLTRTPGGDLGVKALLEPATGIADNAPPDVAAFSGVALELSRAAAMLSRAAERETRAASPSAAGEPVKIEIIDQRSSGQPVEAQERRGPDGMRQIRVMIRDEVRQGFARGEYDGSLQQRFGARPVVR